MANFDELMQGSIDMHLHFGPEPVIVRRVTAVTAALQAQEAGMKAIVLKSHSYPTTPVAYFAHEMAPNVEVFGGLCLDFEIGGLNPFAAEASAEMGAKVIWMPTFSAAHSRAKSARLLNRELKGEGISILDSGGQLLTQVIDILHIIKDHDMVLATGHISPAETFALLDESKKIGLSKIVITHALEATFVEAALTLDEQRSLAKEGAFIEHCFSCLLPTRVESYKPQQTVEAIRAVGAEHCIISTDFGQVWNPPPVEGMRMFIATLLKHGLTEDEIKLMARINPAKLLGLESE